MRQTRLRPFALLLLLATPNAFPQHTPGRATGNGLAIVWSPDTVNVIVGRGGQTDTTASLNVLQTIGNVTVSVVPTLSPYLTVSPTTLTNLKPGDSVSIRLTFRAPGSAPLQLFDGTVQIREQITRSGQGRVFARPLPVHLLIREEQGVPGIDNDGNGVWDYIDQYIDAHYQGNEQVAVRSAARQYSRAIEGGLLNAANRDRSLQFAAAGDRAQECMFSLRPQDAGKVLSDLEAVILNNRSRSLTFLMWSEQSAGQVFPSTPYSQRAASCTAQ